MIIGTANLLVMFTSIQVMFVVASFCCAVGPLVLGFILDRFGPRACSVTSITCVTLGFLLFSLPNAPGSFLFIVAMSLIAFGGTANQSAM